MHSESRRLRHAFAGGTITICIAPFACLIILAGCADHISRSDLLARIESDSPPRIVDVRSTSEYQEARVPGAVHIPFYSLLFNLDQLPESDDAEEPFVVYCEHGPRAGIARAQLWLAGAGPVLFMEGHMIAWKADGLPVESDLASSDDESTQALETRAQKGNTSQ